MAYEQSPCATPLTYDSLREDVVSYGASRRVSAATSSTDDAGKRMLLSAAKVLGWSTDFGSVGGVP